MGRANYKHSIPLIVTLAALALFGMAFVDVVFVCVVCVLGTGAAWYLYLAFFHTMDKILNFFYIKR